MTTKQQRQEFIDHVRESAKSLFVPRPLVSEPGNVLPIHEVWLHNLRADLIGTPAFNLGSSRMALGYGPSSWAALASNVEVFDDEGALPEGALKGQGYSDGRTLFVPLSKLKEKVMNDDTRAALSWLDAGLLFHARHLLGETSASSENWIKTGDVDLQSKSAMQYALAQSSPKAGDWFEMHQASKAQDENALLQQSGSAMLHLMRSIEMASSATESDGFVNGPWRGLEISENNDTQKKIGPFETFKSPVRASYRAAGT